MSRRLPCACGCGELLVGKRRHARYLNHAHRMRALRRESAESLTSADPGSGSRNASVAVSAASPAPEMAPEEMRRRLDDLAREFDRAGSTTAVRREGRAFPKALGLPKPRWLRTDDWR
jgi:hypothetical protein